MAIDIDTFSEARGQKYSLIETAYISHDPAFRGTKGEAYFDGVWHYRPFNKGVGFVTVEAKELECANDKGWLKGTYLGDRQIPRQGKAFWNLEVDKWQYRPEGMTREFLIAEGNFVVRRDVDVYDK